MKVVETDDLFKIVDENADKHDAIATIEKTGDEHYDEYLESLAKLMACAEEMLGAMQDLIVAATTVDVFQHAGQKIPPEAWSDVHAARNKAKAVLQKARGQ